jgi:preprotein translocase subunit YajC
MTHLLTLGPSLAAAAKAKGSSAGFLIFLVVIAAAGYFLLLRPQQQKARKQRDLMTAIEVGDEVLTAGGIVGRVLEMNEDRFTILTGEANEEGVVEGTPTRLVMVRSAILRKVEPAAHAGVDEAEMDYDEEDDEADEDDTGGRPGEEASP